MPNLGMSQQTLYGVLEMSDWLIVPFICLLMLAPSASYPQKISRFNAMLLAFLVWACMGILTIHFRYEYLEPVPVLVTCVLKLGKLAVYTIAGILIPRKLLNSKLRSQWQWSLLTALCMLGVGLIYSSTNSASESADALSGYKSYNAIVVSMAILCCYVMGMWVDNVGTRRWRICAALSLLFAAASVLLSTSSEAHGRGGWLALVAGCGYLLWKKSRRTKAFTITFLLASVVVGAYATLPNVQSLIDSTISPSPEESALNSGTGVDDGARLSTWTHEAPKFIQAPVLGSGFYHRGGESGLWDTGSHNFFLQMFLETGIVGGAITLLLFVLMWRQTSSFLARHERIAVATRAALVAAFIGGMSGEYYYGGITVLVLFAASAQSASLPGFSREHMNRQALRLRELEWATS